MEQTASGNWLDLLSGEDTTSFSHPLAQNHGTGGGDLLDFLGEAATEEHGETDHDFSSLVGNAVDNGTEKYINYLKVLQGSQMVGHLFNFLALLFYFRFLQSSFDAMFMR
ncbi:unnamed protein product [Linum trigynum]|uniref:Uncharacterized protein n=1 Tax=Linum trigynum TaxID=586398 RepID=A0AAV2G6V0_9ROSI